MTCKIEFKDSKGNTTCIWHIENAELIKDMRRLVREAYSSNKINGIAFIRLQDENESVSYVLSSK